MKIDIVEGPMEKQGELIPKERTSIVEPDPVIRLAMDPNVDPDKLQKVIDMFNAQKDRQAREEFSRHFADMQAEFEPVAKSKQGDKAKYAPLDALQKQFDPIIHKHGFSYRWNESTAENGRLRITLTVSGYGHSEQTEKELPPYEPDKGGSTGKPIMNTMQAEGVRSTYGYRYAYRAAFGLVIEDEDTDGSFEDGVKYGEYIKLVEESTDMDELKANRITVFQGLGADPKGKKILTQVMRKKAKELEK